MSSWWVNQGRTFVQERTGGYLWAPLRSAAGYALVHWDSMAQLRPGDTIFHFAAGSLRALSTVLAPAKTLEEAQRVAFNNYLDAVVCGFFVLLVVAMCVYAIIISLQALRATQPTVKETPLGTGYARA